MGKSAAYTAVCEHFSHKLSFKDARRRRFLNGATMNKYIYPVRVHIEDTDCTGTVYHANYFNFMERARSEWIDELGFGILKMRELQMQFVIHSASIRYLKPAFVHDRLEVVTVIREVGRASMMFDQHLRSSSMPDKMFCKAEIKIACVDLNLRPRALPDLPILKTIRSRL
jgi:tol-pal system-associated acyl-CoA thioesterase